MAHSEPFAQCQGSDPIAQLWQADFYLNKPMKKYLKVAIRKANLKTL
jgi:hypothetical protein